MPVILYERQRQILDFISQFIQRNSYAPTLKDIGQAMGLNSLATVHEHLHQLVKKGVMKIYGKGKNRRMEIVDKKLANRDLGVQLPIVGFLAEGQPIETYTETNAFYHVSPAMLTGNKRCLVLEIKDDSLLDEGLRKEDYLILEEDPKLNDGDSVVALLEGNLATFKRFYKEATRVRLEPIFSQKTPIYAVSVKIQGKAILSVRRY